MFKGKSVWFVFNRQFKRSADEEIVVVRDGRYNQIAAMGLDWDLWILSLENWEHLYLETEEEKFEA